MQGPIHSSQKNQAVKSFVTRESSSISVKAVMFCAAVQCIQPVRRLPRTHYLRLGRPERENHHSSASDVKVTIKYMEFDFHFPRTNSYRGTISRGKLYIFVPKITNPSRDSSVGIVTSLWARLLRVIDRLPVTDPFSLRYPYRLRAPPSILLHRYCGAIPPGIKRPGHEADS